MKISTSSWLELRDRFVLRDRLVLRDQLVLRVISFARYGRGRGNPSKKSPFPNSV